MLTTSEIAVTAAIWGLTAAGGFFGIRAALRRKKLKTAEKIALPTNIQQTSYSSPDGDNTKEITMGNCGCGHSSGAGPFAEGRELVEFVSRAHGGTLRNQSLPDGGLLTECQGCGAAFTLDTFVARCPACGGVHAVSPPRCGDPANIQFAGVGYQL